MKDRQLLQQALDALTYKKWWRVGLGEPKDPKLEAAITSLNERLAHCDRCGKLLGGEGDIHTCTPPAAQPLGYAHWEERIKDLMKQVGMPNSVSLAGAMNQLVNEMMQATPPAQPAPAGYTKKIEDLILERDDARASRDFYKRRADALQQWQCKMRDPERTIVCDILANGHTLEPAGDRYTPPAAQRQWVLLDDEAKRRCANFDSRDDVVEATQEWVRELNEAAPPAAQPPQRTWVGIPEQDLKQGNESFFIAWREGARWAEAKLKEKNT